MQKDGDAMRVHDQERPEAWRPHVEIHRNEHEIADGGARRAAEAGHLHNVEHRSVLRLQRLAGNAGVASIAGADEERRSPVLDVVGKGGGEPLSPAVRVQMEAGLGGDFGGVRIHDHSAAAESAQAVNAKAYTVGEEVVFNRGAYQPDTSEGRHTLAHELTHVMQQRAGPVAGSPTGDGIALSDPSDRFEREAEARATSLGRSEPVVSAPGGTAQRQAAGSDHTVGQALPLQREDKAPEAAEEEEQKPTQTLPLQRQQAESEEEIGAQAMPLQREEAPEEKEEEEAKPA
jgi:hypothetical protein